MSSDNPEDNVHTPPSGSRDDGATAGTDRRSRILDSAVAEFAEHGLAGARVDRIASRAGANKQLIYHYFGDKAGLFDAAISVMAQRYEQVRASLPEELGDRLVAYFDGARRDRDVIRMLQWEALETAPGDYVERTARRDHMQLAVRQVVADQAAGELPAGLDAAQLFLSFQALAAHALAFPQMTEFITGHRPDDPRFVRDRQNFLRALGRLLTDRR